MKKILLIFIFGIIFSLTFVSAANNLQIWRNASTGTNVSYVDNEGDWFMNGYLNVSGLIYGNGSQLTDISTSAIDLSDYVPYIGANQDLVLGENDFSVGGTDLYVNSSLGRVSIGTTSSGGALTIDPNGVNAIYITESQPIRWSGGPYIGTYGGLMSMYSGGLDMTFRGYNGSTVLDALYMDVSGNSGKIGIGTTNPQQELNVIGDANITGDFYLDDLTSNRAIKLSSFEDGLAGIYFARSSDGGYSSSIKSDNYLDISSGGGGSYTRFIVSGTEVMRMPFSRRVGIGITDPVAQLDLQAINTDMLLKVGDDVLVINDSVGNVGIGTDNPQQKLNVIGDANITGLIYGDGSRLTNLNLSGVNGSTQWGDNGNDIYYNDGNVGIGTSSPTSKLDIVGSYAGGTSDNGESISNIYDSNSVLRTQFLAGGSQAWFLNSGSSEVGQIRYSTPGGEPGIVFFNSVGTGRSQIKQFSSAGGLAFGATTSSSNPSDQLILTTSGNVGIGTTSPYNKLHILESAVTGSDSHVDDILVVERNDDSNINIISASNATGGFLFSDETRAQGVFRYNHDGDNFEVWTASGSPSDVALDLRDNGDVLLAQTSGNVGIGTDSPEQKLHVVGSVLLDNAGDLNISYDSAVDDTHYNFELLGAEQRGFVFTPSKSGSRYIKLIGSASSSDEYFIAQDDDGSDYTRFGNINGNGYVLSTGNFGVNTTSPQNTLNVVGDINATGYIYGDGSRLTNLNLSGVNGSTQWGDNGNDIYYNDGNVGIGTASPDVELDVQGDVAINDTIYLSGNSRAGLLFDEGSTNDAFFMLDSGYFQIQRRTGAIPGDIGTYGATVFRISLDAPNHAFYLNSVGNVGLGTMTPQNKLNVIGDGNFTGDLYSNGQLIASGKLNSTAWNRSGLNVYLANSGDEVGIGTNSPTTTLDVVSTGANGLVLNNDLASSSDSARLFFEGDSQTYVLMNDDGKLSFRSGATTGSASGTGRMTLDSNGNLGINEVNPESTLHVKGDVIIEL